MSVSFRTGLRAILLAPLATALLACSSEGPTEPPPTGPGPVADVQVVGHGPLELIGQTRTLLVRATDAAGLTVADTPLITWESADTSVAIVDATGRVTATGLGTATVTATVSGISGSATFSVTGPTSLDFMDGDWTISHSDGLASTSSIGPLTGGIREEVRARSARETARVLTRIDETDGVTWHYARADGERRRMQYFRGTLATGAPTVLTTPDGEARILVERPAVDGFQLRLQTNQGGAWVDETTETYARGSSSGAGDAPTPCLDQFRHFDFWVGTWNVTDASGVNRQGGSEITSIVDGCAIREQWTSGGGVGYSLNMYDPHRDDWTQVWMDDSGLELHLVGELVDSAMVLSGTASGQLQRITWSPLDAGRVRQHWEVSNTGGSSWTTSFDGYYNPIN